MKKLILNEDLFEPFEFSELFPDDIIEEPTEVEIPAAVADAEINVVEEETPSGPATGAETGIANQLIEMINGEWNTIADYNNLITMLTQYGFEEFIPVIEDINNEENLHVGQLQALLQKISPNAGSIEQGELEASNDQGLTEDILPIHKFNHKRYSVNENPDGSYAIHKISPYDEAEYVWAKSDSKEPDYFRFYHNGKEIPSPMYSETEDFSDIINTLIELNADIKPIPSYN